MDPDTSSLLIGHIGAFSSFALLVVAILIHSILSAAEYLILSGKGEAIQESETEVKQKTINAIQYLEQLNNSLPSIQFGLSLSSIIFAWLCSDFFLTYIIKTSNYTSLYYFLFIFIISIFHSVTSGIVTKTLAIQYSENSINLFLVPTSIIIKIFAPINIIVSKLSNKILSLWKTEIPASIPRIQSTEDISALVSHGSKTGVIDKEKENLLRGVVGFSDTVAREVMTARTDLISIAVDSSLTEVIEIVKEHSYSRYPVHGTNTDDIIGILLSKDLLDFLSAPGNSESNFRLNKIMRDPYFIQGSKPIDSLLTEFRQRKLHIAIVLDEHGGVDGLITLEDILEEIVGDIYDESDSHDNDIQLLEDGSLIVDGGVLVADLNERFPINIPEGDYDTIAGFIFNSMHKMPKEGEMVELEEYNIIALKVVAHRIETVKIVRKSNI